jgi:S-formylglutathione hydrolase FrmB
MKVKIKRNFIKTAGKVITAVTILANFVGLSCSQDETHSLSFKLSVADELQNEFHSQGRLFICIDKYPDIDPFSYNMGYGYCFFGKNFTQWKAKEILTINSSKDWDSYQPSNFLINDDPEKGWYVQKAWEFENIPDGTYYFQFLWDQNTEESDKSSPGNLYSKTLKVEVNRSMNIEMTLSEIIPPLKLMEHELIKEIQLKSDTLSKWWGKPVILKASVLLPSGFYKNPITEYPIRYDVAGYGGRYTRINSIMTDESFSNWWLSGEAPQLINVYLDGEGPLGDCYQIDSEMGPYGYALIHELIPYIEEKYRGTQSSETRFVSGCSTGGWSSLALQLFYPEIFNGVFSYSPDPVDFSSFLLINIYNDKNFYINNFGSPQPVARSIDNKIWWTWKELINYERVLSPTNSYLGSRFMTSTYMALFSPKGENGLPLSLFDEETGKIDSTVAEHWKKYDLLLYTKNNWNELGPKLKGKIYIWMGDMDGFFLNGALRNYDRFLKSTENPKSDAVIEFAPMRGHCAVASQRNRIEKAAERLAILQQKIISRHANIVQKQAKPANNLYFYKL